MTPQEKELITTLLDRLRNAGGQPKDAEADALIRQALAAQPDAPYYLVQTVLIQDLALNNAQSRIAELERQVTDARQQVAKPTSFLGSLFGHHTPAPSSPPPPAGAPPAGPWSRGPQAAPPPGYGQASYAPSGYGQPAAGPTSMLGGGGGSGFLRSAAATAAGVAGGALLFQGIESLFGHHAMGGILGGQPMAPGLGETVVNNYYGSDTGGPWGDAGGAGGGPGQDFGGDQDFSGGQDYGAGQDFGGGDQDFGGGDQDFGGGDFSNDSTC
ncbi:MAG TPA: DUF2076 domain-containing protein [Stellaceae bacterium]|nr:DUF2076 domain-containing protein [Stellaceae bacterium]